MKQEDIIRMAREAGLIVDANQSGFDSVEAFAALVEAAARADEREAIYAKWHSCVMSDLENGVKCLNEKAFADWDKNYPAQSKMFPEWIEERGQA
jgi:hypothetical protein